MKQAFLPGLAGVVLSLSLPALLPMTTTRISAQAPSAADMQKARELYREAYTQQIGKQYAKANELFEQILGLLSEPKSGQPSKDHNQILYNMACNHALLGEKAAALARLEQAIALGYWDHEFLARDPSLESLREAPKFKELLGKCREGLGGIAFRLVDADGKTLKKEDFKGKVLLLDVWGTWCGFCVRAIPDLVKLQEKYGKDGLQVLGLIWEKRLPDDGVRARVKQFALAHKINYPIVFVDAPGLLQNLGVGGFPTTFLIGRDGVARKGPRGYGESGNPGYEVLERMVKPLLAEKPPAPEAGPLGAPR